MAAARTIKKYANRRLYDTEASRHVTLADIRELIVGGTDVDIVDDVTGENLTRQLLLQIIVDSERAQDPLLSEPLLTRLIRFYGDPMQHVMGEYLERSVGTFLAQQDAVRTQMESMLKQTPLDTMQAMMKRNFDAWESIVARSAPPVAPADARDDRDDTRSGA